MSTNEWLLTSDFWQFLEPWHGRWYEYEIFIASCTDNIYDLENERWLLRDMIDHVGIYGSRVAEGLSAFNGGLVIHYDKYIIYVNLWFSINIFLPFAGCIKQGLKNQLYLHLTVLTSRVRRWILRSETLIFTCLYFICHWIMLVRI